jgi:hypothetical protein
MEFSGVGPGRLGNVRGISLDLWSGTHHFAANVNVPGKLSVQTIDADVINAKTLLFITSGSAIENISARQIVVGEYLQIPVLSSLELSHPVGGIAIFNSVPYVVVANDTYTPLQIATLSTVRTGQYSVSQQSFGLVVMSGFNSTVAQVTLTSDNSWDMACPSGFVRVPNLCVHGGGIALNPSISSGTENYFLHAGVSALKFTTTTSQTTFLEGYVMNHELRAVDVISDVPPNTFTELFNVVPVVSEGYCYHLEFQAIMSGLSDLSGAETWLQVSSDTVLSNFMGVFRGATGHDVIETTFMSTADRVMTDVSNISFQVTNPAPTAHTKRCINGSLRFDVLSSSGTVDMLFSQTAGPSTIRVLPGSYLRLACLGTVQNKNPDNEMESHTNGTYVTRRSVFITLSNLIYNMSINHWNTLAALQDYTALISLEPEERRMPSDLNMLSATNWSTIVNILPSVTNNSGKTLYFDGTNKNWLSAPNVTISTKMISQTSYTTLSTDQFILVNDTNNTSVVVSLVQSGMVDGQFITIKRDTNNFDKTVAVFLRMSQTTVTSYSISLSNGTLTAMYSNAVSGYVVVSAELGRIDPPRGSVPNVFTTGSSLYSIGGTNSFTISGTSMLTVSQVIVGTTELRILTKVSNRITAFLPGTSEPGFCDVKLVDYWGASRTLSGAFQYVPYASLRLMNGTVSSGSRAGRVAVTNTGIRYRIPSNFIVQDTWNRSLTKTLSLNGIGGIPSVGLTCDRQIGKTVLVPATQSYYFSKDYCTTATRVWNMSETWTDFKTSPDGNYTLGTVARSGIRYSTVNISHASLPFVSSTITSSNLPSYDLLSSNLVVDIRSNQLSYSDMSTVLEWGGYVTAGSGSDYIMQLSSGYIRDYGVVPTNSVMNRYFESTTPAALNLSSNGGFTIAFTYFVDPINITRGALWPVWFSSKSSTNYHDAIYFYYNRINGGQFTLDIYNGGSSTSNGTRIINAKCLLTPVAGVWNRVIFSVGGASGSRPLCYMNGKPVVVNETLTQALTDRENTTQRFLQSLDSNTDTLFAFGTLDSLLVWDRAYTATEIEQLQTSLDGFNTVDMSVNDTGHALAIINIDPTALYRSTDGGATWEQVLQGAYGRWTCVAVANNGFMYACVNNGFIYSSTDSGSTWTQRGTSNAWYAIATDETGRYVLASTTAGLLATSFDYGVTFLTRSTGEANNFGLTISPDASLGIYSWNLLLYFGDIP